MEQRRLRRPLGATEHDLSRRRSPPPFSLDGALATETYFLNPEREPRPYFDAVHSIES